MTKEHNDMLIDRIKGIPATPNENGAIDMYSEAQKKFLKAAFALRLAERDLNEAQDKFNTALSAVEALEQEALPNFREMRGVLKSVPTEGAS